VSIYVPRGGAHFRHTSSNGQADHEKIRESRAALANVCIRIPHKGYEISISCDDSCGVLDRDLSRSDIRVFKDSKDVTLEVMKRETTYADAQSLKRALRNIDEITRGLD
jgi:hypothetical protein